MYSRLFKCSMDATGLLGCSGRYASVEETDQIPDTCSTDSQAGSTATVNSDLFWGQEAQLLQEGAFDYSLQRWYQEPRKCPKLPVVPVTDLQAVLPDDGTVPQTQVKGKNVRTKSKKLIIPAGVQLEVPECKTTTDGSVTEHTEIFDRNHNHRYAYNQACVENQDVASDFKQKFTEPTQRICQSVFNRPVCPLISHPSGSTRGRDVGGKEAGPRNTLKQAKYYPPSNLPKLGMRLGITTTANRPSDDTVKKLCGIYEQENDWSPDGWTIEDGGWEAQLEPTELEFGTKATLSDSSSSLGKSDEETPPPNTESTTKMLHFPQHDFYMTAESLTEDKKAAEYLTRKLTDQNARFRVAVPSGATIRVPLAAINMYDHGCPDPAATGHGVTVDDIKKRLAEEQSVLEKAAAVMTNEATLGALQGRPSLVLKQQNYADLVQSRPLHQPADVGEVRGMQFACAPIDRDAFRTDIAYPKLDLAEIIQTEQSTGTEDYQTLKRLVKDLTDPLPAPVQVMNGLTATSTTDKPGNAHQCMRQYLKDHKMDGAAQKLAQEWWLHHDERCREFPHDTKSYSAVKQYADLAENYALLLREYKTVKNSERKKSKLVNQCQRNIRFLNLNFKRYAAKNAKLQSELAAAEKVSPTEFNKVVQDKSHIDQRFKGTRQLNRSLHAQLRARRVQVNQLVHRLENQTASLKFRLSRKAHPNDSTFPDYHGLNPLGVLSRKKPVQLLKASGMAIQQKIPAHTRAINDMTINPYRHMAVTVGADGQWRAWDVKAMGKPLYEGAGHNGSIYRTEFHPSGDFFATAGMDSLVNFWNAEDGAKRLTMQHLQPVSALSFHSSGDFMLTGCSNGALSLWDLNSQRCLSHLCRWNHIDRVHKGAIVNCQVIAYSNMCITAAEDGDVRLWDLRTESNRIIMNQSQPIKNAEVALNGHIMGTSSKYDSDLKLWDLRKLGQLVAAASYSPQFICDFNFDTSCHLLAMALNNGQVNFWDVKTGTSIVYPAHNSATTVVLWDVWGEYLMSGDEQGNIFMWS